MTITSTWNSSARKVRDWKPLVGKRCIVCEDRPLNGETEVEVLEVSPSEHRVKLKFPSGSESWEKPWKWYLVEVL